MTIYGHFPNDDMSGNENSWTIVKDKDNCVIK